MEDIYFICEKDMDFGRSETEYYGLNIFVSQHLCVEMGFGEVIGFRLDHDGEIFRMRLAFL